MIRLAIQSTLPCLSMSDRIIKRGLMNLANYYDQNKIHQSKHLFKKVFFYRVCGTGMGAVAGLLKENGYTVSGADINFYPPMSTYLESLNVECIDIKLVDADLLRQYDLIVVGNVVPKNSEAATLIENAGVPFCSFPAALGALVLSDKEVIGISGTHGKTTTTYLLLQMFRKLGIDVGYLIGGVVEGLNSASIGSSKYFIIEADEYDSSYFEKYSKFHNYYIKHLILTSLEFDHADIFDSIEIIEQEFDRLIKNVEGEIVANLDYPSVRKLLGSNNHVTFYGESIKTGPHGYSHANGLSSFQLILDRERLVSTNMIGLHNAFNLSANILLLSRLGFEVEQILKTTNDLKLVKRRQEIRGTYQGAIVVDDFAHHPTAIKVTLDALRDQYQSANLVVIFEPMSATARSSVFQDEFSRVFDQAHDVILARPQRQSTVRNYGNIDIEKLANSIRYNSGVDVQVAGDLLELRKLIDRYAQDETVIVILSNNTCLGLWESSFAKEIKKI